MTMTIRVELPHGQWLVIEGECKDNPTLPAQLIVKATAPLRSGFEP